jgi:pimeloyl-ACP methyl ester carboxylesterase
VPGWLTHLELSWAFPRERAFYEALARGRTLVRYDRLGCGLSSASAARAPSFELELETMEVVVRAVGGETFDVLADIFVPDASATDRIAFARYQRAASSAETARQMLALSYATDVSAFLGAVRAPTLVLHRQGDRAAPVAQAELVASSIPGARLEMLDGRTHLPYFGDTDAVVRPVRRFLGLRALRRSAGPTLTRRQLEVAALVADGLTNRAIAERGPRVICCSRSGVRATSQSACGSRNGTSSASSVTNTATTHGGSRASSRAPDGVTRRPRSAAARLSCPRIP